MQLLLLVWLGAVLVSGFIHGRRDGEASSAAEALPNWFVVGAVATCLEGLALIGLTGAGPDGAPEPISATLAAFVLTQVYVGAAWLAHGAAQRSTLPGQTIQT